MSLNLQSSGCCASTANNMIEEQRKSETIAFELKADPNGAVLLPAELLTQLGITAGNTVLVHNTPLGLSLKSTDPALSKLYFEPTNACNLSCQTCIRHSWDESEGFMDMALYKKVLYEAKELSSLKEISFWGFGEPLLHPHILEMIALAKALKVKTKLITNGLLLDSQMARGLIAAGLDTIIVSIDGSSEAVHAEIRSGSDLVSVKDNIRRLRLIRDELELLDPEIGIEFVANQRNVQELGNLRTIAGDIGANFIFVTNLLPYSSDMKEDILYWNSVDMRLPDRGTPYNPRIYMPPIDNRDELAQSLLKLSGPLDLSHQTIHKGNGYCKFVGEGSLVVNWNGDVSPCIPLMHSYSCYIFEREKKFKCYKVGNLEQQSVKEIWRNPDYVSFRERVQRFAFSPCVHCGGCDMAESNEEDCYGNPFPVCGDCLWAQRIIQCP